jgi:hypothetical protein
VTVLLKKQRAARRTARIRSGRGRYSPTAKDESGDGLASTSAAGLAGLLVDGAV